jgi:hypothetical protein
MNPHRLRARPRGQAAYLWLVAKRSNCNRDVRRLLYKLQLVQFGKDYERCLLWDRQLTAMYRMHVATRRATKHFDTAMTHIPYTLRCSVRKRAKRGK